MLKGFHSYFYFCHIKSNHSSLLPFCPKRQKFAMILTKQKANVIAKEYRRKGSKFSTNGFPFLETL